MRSNHIIQIKFYYSHISAFDYKNPIIQPQKSIIMNALKPVLCLLFCLSTFVELWAEGNGTDRKLIEIKKIITLSAEQEDSIRSLHRRYSTIADSALYKIADPIVAAQVKYEANKVFHNAFMALLTEEQRIRYIQVTSAPEIKAKTEAKIQTLRETGDYTEAELAKQYDAIYKYLMLEKVVYVRDKYKISQQKMNISQLKKMQPKALQAANANEKLKHNGKPRNRNYQW